MIEVTDKPLDVGAALNAFCANRSQTGAVASFVGLARGEGLRLESYPGFTEVAMARMAADACRRFSLDDVRISHRVGDFAPGEPIVLVLTAARHRRAAFEACDFLMDHLKSHAPLWKREGERWIEPTQADAEDLARWTRDGGSS